MNIRTISIMNDMHVHTLHSSDSGETMEAYIGRARKIGAGVICFTDHLDVNPQDSGTAFYDSEAFFKDFDKTKVGTRDITLLGGVEFDCPHRYPKELAEISRLPYDCIIGSVHYCDLSPDVFFSELVKSGVTAEDCYNAYWKEVLKCVTFGGFDVLGHIDIPKRYYKALIYDADLLREIFRVLLLNGAIIEINTSSLHKGIPDTMPGRDLLDIYRSEGGKYVTIGSDAHAAAELAADNAIARGLIEEIGLSEVIYINRKMTVV